VDGDINLMWIDSRTGFSLQPSSPHGERSMSLRRQAFSLSIVPERRRWMPFRRALSQEDRAAFDRMCACAKEQRQAAVPLGRPWRFEAVIMAVLWAYEKRLEQVRIRLEAISVEEHLFDGNQSTG
jgi:hypothetical protein